MQPVDHCCNEMEDAQCEEAVADSATPDGILDAGAAVAREWAVDSEHVAEGEARKMHANVEW